MGIKKKGALVTLPSLSSEGIFLFVCLFFFVLIARWLLSVLVGKECWKSSYDQKETSDQGVFRVDPSK